MSNSIKKARLNGSNSGGRRRILTKAIFTSKTDEWETPQWLFDDWDRAFGFTLDPCATHENAKCEKYFTKAEDGLKQDWSDEIVFMNPPFGRKIYHWMKKAYRESLKGATVVCLVPARTDTRWWHTYAMGGEIKFLRGSLKFGNAKNSAPFPSAIIVFWPPAAVLENEAA
jgi:phage N-6-adenine-methyltransferase